MLDISVDITGKMNYVGPMEFLAEVEAFLVSRDMAASRFGKLAMADPGFVARLRENPLSPTLRTVARVRAFMASYKADAA